MKKLLKYVLYTLAFFLVLSICVLSPVNRAPYTTLPFYQTMDARLDSLQRTFSSDTVRTPWSVGAAKRSITPTTTLPLAGYGARKPKEFDRVLDSVFVRAIVLSNGVKKVALLSADLLIVHPEIKDALFQKLAKVGWSAHNVFLGATHSHSSIGSWAPGTAGKIFAGTYKPETAALIADQMVAAILQAESAMEPASVGYINNELGENVKNRLIKGGKEDAWMRNVFFETPSGLIELSAYAAHATCFGQKSRALTGDYPSYFHRALANDSLIRFSLFMAGAVGSMGPETDGLRAQEAAQYIGYNMAEQVILLANLGTQTEKIGAIDAFRLKVPIRAPQMKIARNIKIRPWLFRNIVGEYPVELSVLKMNNTVLIGLPCDFSGELALPLYAYARERNINLIITSFNGGYIGYVTQDDRYDMEKYETRTMNWYGPDSGAYFSEIITRVIDILSQ